MAWCPHCGEDRPIQRQTFEGNCPICSLGVFGIAHNPACRGATVGSFNVCTHCNEPLFAKAKTSEEYIQLEKVEAENCKKPSSGCFVITATMGSSENKFVAELRTFRDQTLLKSRIGTRVVERYYQQSPAIAEKIENSFFLKILAFFLVVLPATCFAIIVNRIVKSASNAG